MRAIDESLRDALPVGLEADLLGRQADGIGDEPTVDPGLGLLARRVDVHHDDLVGGAECPTHLGAEQPGPAEQVRLEADDQPAAARDRSAGLEVAGDLGRVVRIAVVDA